MNVETMNMKNYSIRICLKVNFYVKSLNWEIRRIICSGFKEEATRHIEDEEDRAVRGGR
jgi:hypothetical protein